MINKLEIDSVILEFGRRRILQDVYLKCETGKITGLLGRNGSGKSSLMKILYGELNPDNKSVRMNDSAWLDAYRSPDDIRYLPQHNFIPPHLSVRRILNDFELSIDDLILDFPEFKKHSKSKIKNLSGGEKRIFEIYTILVSSSKFCLLDEPFSQVMPIHVEAIKKIISREKSNKGILLTDHLYKHILDICDDLYVISKGKTHLTSSTEDLVTLGYIRS